MATIKAFLDEMDEVLNQLRHSYYSVLPLMDRDHLTGRDYMKNPATLTKFTRPYNR